VSEPPRLTDLLRTPRGDRLDDLDDDRTDDELREVISPDDERWMLGDGISPYPDRPTPLGRSFRRQP
jgi:hypothetical protein